MNKIEHLQKIKTKCQSLLQNAEKRTRGEWPAVGGNRMMVYYGHPELDVLMTNDDCRFIASCAGAAEAGWKTTIGSINELDDMPFDIANALATQILSAWPLELLD